MQNKNNYPLFLLGILLIFTCYSTTTSAQANWYQFDSAQHFAEASPYVFIYRVPTDSVHKIVFDHGNIDPSTPWMQQPFAIILTGRTDSFMASNIPAGYYLSVNSYRNSVQFQLRYKQSFFVNTINLRDVLLMTIKDTADRDIQADVHIGDRLLNYNNELRGYVLQFKNKEKLTVQKEGDIQFYNCSKIKNRIYRNNDYNYDRNYSEPVVFDGYLVTNKPKYLPGDTVKYKAYLLYPKTSEAANERVRINLLESGMNGSYSPSYYGKNFLIRDSMRYEEPGCTSVSLYWEIL